jgi:short-subunit dehydrogenase
MTTRTWNRALVTGASSGIGEAFCRQLAAAGTDLIVVARSKDKLESLAGELMRGSGSKGAEVVVEVLAADLSDRDELAQVERRLADTEHPVDLLVNNAGFGFSGIFGEIPLEDEEREIQVNVTAVMRLCHAAIGRMKETGGGGILNLSSTASFQPGPGSANYSATKAYVTSFSQALHEEHKGRGIHVSTLCPGLTRTEFQTRGGYDVNVPGFFWQTADEVAAIGLRAVSSNKAVAVAGLPNKTMQVATRLAPIGVARWGAAQVLNRMR